MFRIKAWLYSLLMFVAGGLTGLVVGMLFLDEPSTVLAVVLTAAALFALGAALSFRSWLRRS